MTGAGTAQREREATQHLPAALRMDGTTKLLAHPASDLGTTPHTAVRSRTVEQGGKLRLKLIRQQGSVARIVVATITKTGRSLMIVAVGQGTNPGDGVAGGGDNLSSGRVVSEQPNDLPMAARD
jgi:hypothetical protein